MMNLSLFLTLVSILACRADEGSRLGASLSNYESVGTGRTFTSEPQPPIDRRRLLQEMTESMTEEEVEAFDSEVIPDEVGEDSVGEAKVFSQPIARRLRRIGGGKKTSKESSAAVSKPSQEGEERDLSSCQNVKIELTIDKYGKETSVYLKNKSTGKTVMSSVKEVPAYQSKTISDCVSPGTYTLLLQDIDGLCCKNGKGGYKLSVDGTELVNGGYFVKSTSHTIKIGYNWESSMSSRDKEWLSAHNSRRRTAHQRAGKSYRSVRWAPSLASDSEKWAKQLLSGCSQSGIDHQGGVGDGENLAKNKGAGQWGSLYSADKILGRWVENEMDDKYPHNAHMTQVIWYSTQYVGCGESLKSMGNSQKCRVQVCRYARPGNCNVKNGNWRSEAFKDDTGCGEPCPTEGCYA